MIVIVFYAFMKKISLSGWLLLEEWAIPLISEGKIIMMFPNTCAKEAKMEENQTTRKKKMRKIRKERIGKIDAGNKTKHNKRNVAFL